MFRLLIVDDEEVILDGLRLLLPWKELGVSIIATATSAEEALEIIKNQKVDILLTDISMDELSGLDLINQLNQIQPSAKSLVLSGFNEFDYLKKGLQLGIENYLLKPINAEELQQTIETITDKLRSDVRLGSKNGVLKEHISKRLFFNQISKYEFIERATLLQLPLPKENCRICLISLRSGANTSGETMDYLALENLFRGHAFPYCAQLDTNSFAFLSDSLSLTELKTNLKQLTKEIDRSDLSLSYRIFVGLERPLFNQLHLSLESAENMQEYYRLFGNQKIYFYEDFEEQQLMDNIHSDAALFQTLDNAIDTRNKQVIVQQIHEIFSTHTATPQSPNYIKTCAYLVLLKFFQGFNKIYLEEFQLFAKNLEQVKTLEEISFLLLGILDKLFLAVDFSRFSAITQELLQLVTTDYQRSLSLKSASQKLHVNTAYLGQLFQKELGVSFSEYLLNYRMQLVKQQLSQSNDSIESIAIANGFKDVSYFSKKFKQLFNQTPNDYRRKHR